MPNNRDEDRALTKAARTSLSRTILDVGELQISCVDGYVELTGKVRAPRGHTGHVDFKKEIEQIRQHMKNVRGVKEVYTGRILIIK